MFKVGSELFTAAGPDLVTRIIGEGQRIFLDLKFHDIPNTAAGAVRAAARLGVHLLNVHAAGGAAMMKSALEAACETSPHMRLIAVTLLTSLGASDLSDLGLPRAPGEQVLRLAEMAAGAGLHGVVASPEEAALLRARFPRPFLLVTPGIRPDWQQAGSAGSDQKRVATPAAAIRAGADFIVVGRPITQAADPRAAALRVIEEIGEAGSC